LAFVVKDWHNLAAGGTPINEAALEDLERRVTDYVDDQVGGVPAGVELIANKDTDSTFAANSDVRYPSQKAVKTAMDALTGGSVPTPVPNTVLTSDGASVVGWRPDGNVPNVALDYGAVDGGADSTAAFQTAFDDNNIVYVPGGTYLCDPLVVTNGPMTIVGDGKSATRIKARTPGTYLITFNLDLGQPGTEATYQRDLLMRDLFLDGNGRSLAIGGVKVDRAAQVRFDGVRISHFLRTGLEYHGVRECVDTDTYVRWCGSPGYPALYITDHPSTDPPSGSGTNNLSFFGLRVLYAGGPILRIQTEPGLLENRHIHFFGPMFHQTLLPIGEQPTLDGYTYSDADFRYGEWVQVEDSPNINFFAPRFARAAGGRGQALVRVTGSRSDVYLDRPSYGAATAEGLLSQAVTADATANTLTTTSAALYLATGAIVRISTTGTLPSPLVAGTDYWWIKVDDNTGKLASTYLNAAAGTAIDLTTAGTGTHTLTSREVDVELVDGDVTESNPLSDQTTDRIVNNFNSARFHGLTSEGEVRAVRVTGTDTTYVARHVGDAYNRWKVDANGAQGWGPGSGGTDVALSRSAADVLALGDGDGFQFGEVAADLATPAANRARQYLRPNASTGKSEVVFVGPTGDRVVIPVEF
jgi:Pectate lyase superfamily protein